MPWLILLFPIPGQENANPRSIALGLKESQHHEFKNLIAIEFEVSIFSRNHMLKYKHKLVMNSSFRVGTWCYLCSNVSSKSIISKANAIYIISAKQALTSVDSGSQPFSRKLKISISSTIKFFLIDEVKEVRICISRSQKHKSPSFLWLGHTILFVALQNHHLLKNFLQDKVVLEQHNSSVLKPPNQQCLRRSSFLWRKFLSWYTNGCFSVTCINRYISQLCWQFNKPVLILLQDAHEIEQIVAMWTWG